MDFFSADLGKNNHIATSLVSHEGEELTFAARSHNSFKRIQEQEPNQVEYQDALRAGLHTSVGDVWLDWDDVFENPESATIHMFTHSDPHVSFDVKLERMEKFESGIRFFDSIAKPMRERITAAGILAMLNVPELPRPTHIELNTNNSGLLRLFHKLGIHNPVPFDILTQIAQSRRLVSEWRVLKGK